MKILDIIIVIWLILDIIDGFRKGFIVTTFSIAAIFLGIFLAQRFSSWTAELLNLNNQYAEYIAVAVTFCVVVAAVMLGAWAISKMIRMIGLGFLNSLGGGVMGLIRGVIVIGLLCMLFSNINRHNRIVSQSKLDKSYFYNPLVNIADTLFPYLSDFDFEGKMKELVSPAMDLIDKNDGDGE